MKTVKVPVQLPDGRKGFREVISFNNRNPFQPKNAVKATILIKAATFTEKAVVKEVVYHLPFMEAIIKAQQDFPNAIRRSYTTINFKPSE